MTDVSNSDQTQKLEVSAGSIFLIFMSLGVAALAISVLVSARAVISWIVACAVSAALLELIIQYLERYMRRWVAIVLVLLAVAATASVLTWGVFDDLDHEVRRLRSEAPRAALQLEHSEKFGGIAREARLHERISEAASDFNQPSSGLAGRAVTSVGTYVICAVLTILFLSWGPRIGNAAMQRLGEERGYKAKRIAHAAIRRSRRYVIRAIAQSSIVGLIAWFACYWADIPAPAPLALTLAVCALLPNIGILLGSFPILLIAYGVGESLLWAQALTVLLIGLQLISTFVIQPRIVKKSDLYVGPAIIAIAFLAGYELYGIGGALYAAALIVLALAALDANIAESNNKSKRRPRDLTTSAKTLS